MGAAMIIKGTATCTVCGASDDGLLYRKEQHCGAEGGVELYRCGNKRCRTVFLGNICDDFEEELYDYYKRYLGLPKEQVFDPITGKRYRALLENFARYCAGTTVFDVGCGKGDFVDAALAAGWNASGIELSRPAVEVAASFGLPVRNLDFFSGEIAESSVDVLTMFEVVEHLPAPVRFLRRAERVVRPGGLVYLTTPNFDSLDRRILGTEWEPMHREHLNYFTPATLRRLIRKETGLEVVSLVTRNISPKLLSRLRPRRGNSQPQPEQLPSGGSELREQIERSTLLLSGKRLANRLIGMTPLGSSIVLLLRRRG